MLCTHVPALRRRWLLRTGGCLALLGVTAWLTVSLPATAASDRRLRPTSPLASVTLPLRPTVVAVPRSFLGISTEYWTIGVWAQHVELLDRVLRLVHVDGPLVLRIGGNSADLALWAPGRTVPNWSFGLTPAWLKQASRIIRRTGVHVIIDLNLVTASPSAAARWARIAEAGVPKGSIIGFEIGNEPDIYNRRAWLRVTFGGLGSKYLPPRLTAADYASQFATYASALARIAPGVPLLGPALAEPGVDSRWVATLLDAPHPGLAAVTVHRYPFSACAPPWSRKYPTIARVLGENATAGMARSVGGVVRLARQAGLPVRMTEINSVTCGGVRGVSNTFATALWAPDALFSLLAAGVASADVHVRSDAVNEAFALTDHGLVAHPLLYGMALFARTLGAADPKLVALRVSERRSLHLKAWGVVVGRHVLHVLLIDKGRRSARVRMSLPPATGRATVQRLIAPTVRSSSDVTLDGQWLSADGRWIGRPATETVDPSRGAYWVAIRHYSAALVSVRLASSSALRSRASRSPAPSPGSPAPAPRSPTHAPRSPARGSG